MPDGSQAVSGLPVSVIRSAIKWRSTRPVAGADKGFAYGSTPRACVIVRVTFVGGSNMQHERVVLRELAEQLTAEAARVSASGLDDTRREKLAMIRARINAIRESLGLSDS